MRANHLDIVQDEFNRHPPQTGPFGSGAEPESSPLYQARLRDYFEFQQAVLDRLARDFPTERWGYLAIGGENLIDHGGRRVKVGRLCGPDGQLYKIGRDIPTANITAWEDDGIVQNDHGGQASDYYVAFDGATPPPPPPPAPQPDVLKAITELRGLVVAQSLAIAHLESLLKTHEDLSVARHDDNGARFRELKRFPVRFTGDVKIFGVKGNITLDRVLPWPLPTTPPR